MPRNCAFRASASASYGTKLLTGGVCWTGASGCGGGEAGCGAGWAATAGASGAAVAAKNSAKALMVLFKTFTPGRNESNPHISMKTFRMS